MLELILGIFLLSLFGVTKPITDRKEEVGIRSVDELMGKDEFKEYK